MKSLKGVILACRRRELLLQAEEGPVASAEGTATYEQAITRRRAAKGLEYHGLVRTYIAPTFDRQCAWNPRMLHVELTPLGRAVVAVAKDRLLSGRQMRWKTLEPQIAAYMAA